MFAKHKKALLNLAVVMALLGSALAAPTIQARAAAISPSMWVTLKARDSFYSALAYVGIQYTFQATVQNTGNVPLLEVTANWDSPSGWDINSKYDTCSSTLQPGSSCVFTWIFTPQVTGQVYARVYARGHYTDASGNDNRITQSPAFVFNVKSAAQAGLPAVDTGSSSSSGSAGTTTPAINPSMWVTLKARDSYYSALVYMGIQYTFQATVHNTGNVPLDITANFSIPQGWNVSSKYDTCSSSLQPGSSCAFTWEFTPQATGQIYARVYVRGHYVNAAGNDSRITQSPAFLFDMKP